MGSGLMSVAKLEPLEFILTAAPLPGQ